MHKDEIKNVQPHDGNALLAADAVIAGMFVKIEHPHKCTCIAVARPTRSGGVVPNLFIGATNI